MAERAQKIADLRLANFEKKLACSPLEIYNTVLASY